MYNWYNLNISIFLFWYKNICWIYRSDMVHAEQVRIWKTKFIICPKRTMPKWTDEHAFSWFFVPKAWFQSPVSADDTTRNNQTTIPFQKKKHDRIVQKDILPPIRWKCRKRTTSYLQSLHTTCDSFSGSEGIQCFKRETLDD